jgi:hypothetical protein
MTVREGRRRSTLAALVAWVAVGLLACVALQPSAARALTSTLLDQTGQDLAAYRGWAAWSRYDPTTKQFALVLRSPTGVVTLPTVSERATAFDVELGPEGTSVAAVYSRCSDSVSLVGCQLYELPLDGSQPREQRLAVPGGGSLHEPAIWQGRLAFLRRNPAGGSEDAANPTARRPDLLLTWKRGSNPQRVSLPASKGSRGAGWPRGLTGLISGLTLNGSALAYTTASGVKTTGFELSMFTLWYQRLGQGARLIDQLTAGQANVCLPSVLSPTLAGSKLYAYLHVCDPSAVNLDRWMRYDVRTRKVERASVKLTSSSEASIGSVVPEGGGVIWDSEGVRRLEQNLSWTPIGRPKPESFCTHDDLFC